MMTETEMVAAVLGIGFFTFLTVMLGLLSLWFLLPWFTCWVLLLFLLRRDA